MRKILHKIVYKILRLLYGDDLTGFYAGELAQAIETDLFCQGELLGVINIWPDEEEGYIFEALTRDEVTYDV